MCATFRGFCLSSTAFARPAGSIEGRPSDRPSYIPCWHGCGSPCRATRRRGAAAREGLPRRVRVDRRPGSESNTVDGLRQGLRELGHVEGQNIVIEYRYASGEIEALPGLMAELIRLNVDLILAPGPSVTQAARRATSTIPITSTTHFLRPVERLEPERHGNPRVICRAPKANHWPFHHLGQSIRGSGSPSRMRREKNGSWSAALARALMRLRARSSPKDIRVSTLPCSYKSSSP
jgi:hypothetical protein